MPSQEPPVGAGAGLEPVQELLELEPPRQPPPPRDQDGWTPCIRFRTTPPAALTIINVPEEQGFVEGSGIYLTSKHGLDVDSPGNDLDQGLTLVIDMDDDPLH